MAWLTELPAAALFAAACNLDTVLLAAGFSARGAGLGRGYGLGLAALTTLITWLSLALGSAGARLLGGRLAGRLLGKYALPLAGVLLAALGLWEALPELA